MIIKKFSPLSGARLIHSNSKQPFEIFLTFIHPPSLPFEIRNSTFAIRLAFRTHVSASRSLSTRYAKEPPLSWRIPIQIVFVSSFKFSTSHGCIFVLLGNFYRIINTMSILFAQIFINAFQFQIIVNPLTITPYPCILHTRMPLNCIFATLHFRIPASESAVSPTRFPDLRSKIPSYPPISP
jgi:hypothetical protein